MKVVCVINPKNKYSLTIGKEYDIISFENGKYTIRNDKGHSWSFNQWYFKSISEIKSKIRNDKLELLLTE